MTGTEWEWAEAVGHYAGRWPNHWRVAEMDAVEQGQRFARKALWAKWIVHRFLQTDHAPGTDVFTRKEGWS